ncbi:MAG: YaiI/YqxD family protein [Paracoccaceae bacterium]
MADQDTGGAIYIDADACPVKAEAERVAVRHGMKMFMVSNGGIRPSSHPLVESVFVPDGPDVADMWIAERVGPGDVVVTGDIPLAAKCVAAGALVVKHNGEALTAANIGNVLATRDLMQDLRSADPFRQGGGRPFSKADRSRFLEVLERLVRAAKAG